MRRRVVITGLGTINSLSSDLEKFWQAICQGQSGIGLIESFDTREYKVKFGGEVKDFEPEKYIDPHEAKRLDRFAAFALAAAVIAVRDSRVDIPGYMTPTDPVLHGHVNRCLTVGTFCASALSGVRHYLPSPVFGLDGSLHQSAAAARHGEAVRGARWPSITGTGGSVSPSATNWVSRPGHS